MREPSQQDSHASVRAGCDLQRLEDILTELDERPLSPEDM